MPCILRHVMINNTTSLGRKQSFPFCGSNFAGIFNFLFLKFLTRLNKFETNTLPRPAFQLINIL